MSSLDKLKAESVEKEMNTEEVFKAKHANFLEKNSTGLPPISLENYRTNDGYIWVYNIMQMEIMQSKYKELGGVNDLKNIDDWGSSSSMEYNRAVQAMILMHGDELLKKIHDNFYEMVDQVRTIMNTISGIEKSVENDLHIDHTTEGREMILKALAKILASDPKQISEALIPEVRSRVLQLVEDEVRQAA